MLCSLLLGGTLHREDDNPVMRGLQRVSRPVLETALARRALTVAVAVALCAGALLAARGIGSEFMPPLDEGDVMFMPIADPSISLDENTRNAATQNTILASCPEVASAVAKVGRAETPTEPAPLNMTETIVHLKPRDAWRPGMTPDRLRAEMSRAVHQPGVSPIWTMPIVNRIDMLTTGIRSEVGVKMFGTDLTTLEGLARQVADAVRAVPGASNVYPEQVTSGQYLNIEVDRAAAAALALLAAGAGAAYVGLRPPAGTVSSTAAEPAASASSTRATAPAPGAAPVPAGSASVPPTSGALPDVVVPLGQEAATRARITVTTVGTGTASGVLRLPGVVAPIAYTQVVVTPLTAGRMSRVAVELGAQVRRGQTRAQMFSPDLAEAQVRYISARAELEAHDQELTRTEKLVAIGAASGQALERIHAEHTARRAGIQGAASRLQLLGVSGQALARLGPGTTLDSISTVPAPIAGVVTERLANSGLNVDPSSTLFTVVDRSTVWVVANLYEKDFARSAVQHVADRTVVYLVNPQEAGTFIEREVELGVAQGDVVVAAGSFSVRAERERLGLRAAAARTAVPAGAATDESPSSSRRRPANSPSRAAWTC